MRKAAVEVGARFAVQAARRLEVSESGVVAIPALAGRQSEMLLWVGVQRPRVVVVTADEILVYKVFRGDLGKLVVRRPKEAAHWRRATIRGTLTVDGKHFGVHRESWGVLEAALA